MCTFIRYHKDSVTSKHVWNDSICLTLILFPRKNLTTDVVTKKKKWHIILILLIRWYFEDGLSPKVLEIMLFKKICCIYVSAKYIYLLLQKAANIISHHFNSALLYDTSKNLNMFEMIKSFFNLIVFPRKKNFELHYKKNY